MTALADGARAAVLAALRDRLAKAGIDSAANDAEAILLHALRISRTDFWRDPATALTAAEIGAVAALAARREKREPLQQLIGSVGFHEITLDVAPGVFIPRPETETLVASVLETLGPARAAEGGRLLDLGAGTGAVSIALLAALPRWTGVAIDRSPAALALTERNAARQGLGLRFQALEGDFMAAAAAAATASVAAAAPKPAAAAWGATPYDLLVSNPPYIPTGALAGLMPEVRDHDPRLALDGGPDGLDAYRAIRRLLPALLRPEGLLALEIGDDQADAILSIMGPGLEAPQVRRDLAGRPRVVLGTWRGGVA
ncbi:MAG TPA: peptide chain release factor N(5)-glutamine methyltransferase [Candidatus Eisenbacteria bacterium]|nr:peptide chain release factor N(5)-glutamine methyltransferase [Candidatus Eisenbacteria bacterium]